MCVSALASWHDHSASDTASVCGTGAATAPACTFLSSPGPSQGVHQDHVHAVVFTPTTGACSVNATIILPDLRLQQFLFDLPTPCPKPPSCAPGPVTSPFTGFAAFVGPPPPSFSLQLLISGAPCSLSRLHPRKMQPVGRGFIKGQYVYENSCKKKKSFPDLC